MEIKKAIGTNIARYQKEQNLTQQELANSLNISYQAVSKWETGE
ncbi:MAG: helix-turn-helix transcriptional regulator [Ruminococcaceae bacterium]|nr:helix-turn-helix transcriptional regulator [Oscillospiraceae bacterium]